MSLNILILYGSLEGQTEKISLRIADIMRSKGHQVTVQSGEKLPADLSIDNYDAAIIGGPIHMGKYPEYIKIFVTKHRDWLNTVPSAFFTVCMGVHSQRAESRAEAMRYGENFIAQTGWKPKVTGTFSGAVKYTQYNIFTRLIMKLIARREGGSTDTTRDHEYTDWESVEKLARNFMVEIAKP